jgi:glutathione-regulated potassium-efflux system ancillary protein KefC
MSEPNVFESALVYLGATVLAVPLAKRLGFGSVLGYLAAGIAIGPWGLRLVQSPERILHFADFGVVLLMFLIGLELDPRRLRALRRPILGAGGFQLTVTAVLAGAVALAVGVGLRDAVVIGIGMAMSSTAIALQTMAERHLLGTPAGHTGFSILLFQDLAVIPVLALLPLLGGSGGVQGANPVWVDVAEGIGAILAVVVVGRLLTRPLFRFIADAGLREVFTAFSLLIVVGIALLMQAVGLSMALGAFLAGVLLAESEYRRAVETDIEPFKGLLMGLFFIAVGMSMDFSLLQTETAKILTAVLVLLVIKIGVLGAMAPTAGIPGRQRALFAFLLSQGGEFAFVLFAAAGAAGVLAPELAPMLTLVVALSMLATPLLLLVNERLIEPRFADRSPVRPADAIDEQSPVIIVGFGRVGQIVGRLLHANRIPTTILDRDPSLIETIRKFGFKVFYGDGARLDLLRAAGAESARLIVVAVDDHSQTAEIVDLVHQHFPNLTVLARAWDLVHAFDLRDHGVERPERESFEGALRMGETALRTLGFGAYQAKQAAHRFRACDEQTNDRIYAVHRQDLSKRISIAQEARRDLEALIQSDEKVLLESGDREW